MPNRVNLKAPVSPLHLLNVSPVQGNSERFDSYWF